MAVEQAMGRQDEDARTDVWGLGATLYRSVVGRCPFEAPTIVVHDAFTTGVTLPDDLIQGVAVRAAEMHANPFGVSSRRVGDLAVDYASAQAGGMSGAEEMLERFRRLV